MGTIILSFLGLFVLVLSTAYISMTLGFLFTGVPFISSKQAVVQDIFTSPLIRDKEVFFDLGSGDGRFVRAAIDAGFQKGVGFELALWPLILSKLYSGSKYKSRVEWKRVNFLNADWSYADVLFAYTSPKMMIEIEKKFIKEAKSGAVLVSNGFICPNLSPCEHKKIASSDLYYFIKSEK